MVDRDDPTAVRASATTELEAEIARDPDDPAPRLVYMDHLLGQGDPRGELIMLQHRGLVADADALIARHADHFYGRFGHLLRRRTWRLGFLESCTLVLHAADQLAEVLALRSMRALRRLAIKTTDPAAVLAVLAKHDLTPLHHLEIRASAPSPFGPVGPLSRAAPDLRSLALRDVTGDMFMLEDLALPSLRSLTLVTPGDLAYSLASLYAVRWPVLAHLALRTVSTPVPEWAPLFTAEAFPALRDLMFAPGGHGFASLVADLPLLAQLEVLRFATPDPEVDLRIFIARRPRFAHLRRLALPDLPTLGGAPRMQLMTLCGDVRLF